MRGNPVIGLKSSVHQWSERPGFNPWSSHTKDSKIVLDVALLNTQHYCNILTFDPALNQETGASGRRHQDIALTYGQVEFGANATLTGNRWTSNNDITRCHREFESVGVSCSSSCCSRQWEPAPSRGLGPKDPWLSSPAEWEKKVLL